jgi:hypothetical protein
MVRFYEAQATGQRDAKDQILAADDFHPHRRMVLIGKVDHTA